MNRAFRTVSLIKPRLMSTSTKPLVIRQSRNTLFVELNRPQALNSLSLEMCDELTDLLLNKINVPTSSIAAFVVKGNGGKAFCAGGDVKSIWSELKEGKVVRGSGKPGSLHTDFFRNEYVMNFLLGTSNVPQLSIWDGIIMGGGVGISVLGEFRVATEKSLFAMPETAIGLFPDVGSSSWLPHLSDGYGTLIGLTGCRLGAADLLHTGIATHFITSAKVAELEARLASEDLPLDPLQSRRAIKSILDELQAASGKPDEAKAVVSKHSEVISRCFGAHQSTVEDILTALERESSAGNEWASKTLQTLAKMSPSSLKLTLAQLQRGKNLDLAGCLSMEFRMMMHCMRYGDFQEGIRAVLVDKDNKPQWSPATLAEVTPELVESYFVPLGPHELSLPRTSS